MWARMLYAVTQASLTRAQTHPNDFIRDGFGIWKLRAQDGGDTEEWSDEDVSEGGGRDWNEFSEMWDRVEVGDASIQTLLRHPRLQPFPTFQRTRSMPDLHLLHSTYLHYLEQPIGPFSYFSPILGTKIGRFGDSKCQSTYCTYHL